MNIFKKISIISLVTILLLGFSFATYNPYSPILPVTTKNKIDFLIQKIEDKKSQKNHANYIYLLETLITKIGTLGNSYSSNVRITNIINYLVFGLKDLKDDAITENSSNGNSNSGGLFINTGTGASNSGENIQTLEFSCTTRPNYSNTSFIDGTPTTNNQPWQNTNNSSPCYYSCINGYTGIDCSTISDAQQQINNSLTKSLGLSSTYTGFDFTSLDPSKISCNVVPGQVTVPDGGTYSTINRDCSNMNQVANDVCNSHGISHTYKGSKARYAGTSILSSAYNIIENFGAENISCSGGKVTYKCNMSLIKCDMLADTPISSVSSWSCDNLSSQYLCKGIGPSPHSQISCPTTIPDGKTGYTLQNNIGACYNDGCYCIRNKVANVMSNCPGQTADGWIIPTLDHGQTSPLIRRIIEDKIYEGHVTCENGTYTNPSINLIGCMIAGYVVSGDNCVAPAPITVGCTRQIMDGYDSIRAYNHLEIGIFTKVVNVTGGTKTFSIKGQCQDGVYYGIETATSVLTCSTQGYSKVGEQCFKNCDGDGYQSCAANHGTKKTLYFNKDNAGERIDQTCIQGNRSFSANATCNNGERVNWH